MLRSEEQETRSLGAVDGVESLASSGPAIDGEKETLYTGAEWPMRRRELDGGGSFGPALTADLSGSPWRCQTRM
jgi:hypothetical protein